MNTLCIFVVLSNKSSMFKFNWNASPLPKFSDLSHFSSTAKLYFEMADSLNTVS